MNNVVSMKGFVKSRFDKLQKESDKAFQLGNRYEAAGATGFAKKCRQVWGQKVPEKAKIERLIKRMEKLENPDPKD